MKKVIKITATIALFLCTSFLSVNELKAQSNSQQQCTQGSRTGTIVFLNTGTNSTQSAAANSGSGQNQNSNEGSTTGIIVDDVTGNEYEFKYAGLEVLQINEKYIYILQITASGKIIIRDIHHSN